MRTSFKTAMFVLALVTAPVAAQAGTIEGVAIGAGAGAVVAGPPGAVVGGVAGAVVGGPNLIARRHYAKARRVCWHDSRGINHCRWR